MSEKRKAMFVVVSLRIKFHHSERLHRIPNIARLLQDSLLIYLQARFKKLVLCEIMLVYFI